MSKLLGLRKTLRIEEAAAYLGSKLGETVEPADLVSLVIEGRLELWVNPPEDTWADVVIVVEEANAAEVAKTKRRAFATAINGWTFIDGKDLHLSGLYRYPCIGANAQFLRAYERQRGWPEDDLTFDEFLLQTAEGEWLMPGPILIREGEKFPSVHPWYWLPEDCALCIQREQLDGLAIEALQQSMEAASARAVEPVGGYREQNSWPWGSHQTRALSLLADAGRKWWSNYLAGEPDTAPRNEDVARWLQERGATQRQATAIASLLRADDLPPGRRG